LINIILLSNLMFMAINYVYRPTDSRFGRSLRHKLWTTGKPEVIITWPARDANPTATPRFSRILSQVEHYPTAKYTRIVQNSTWRRRNRKYLQVRL